jgi:hypothetical protein
MIKFGKSERKIEVVRSHLAPLEHPADRGGRDRLGTGVFCSPR